MQAGASLFPFDADEQAEAVLHTHGRVFNSADLGYPPKHVSFSCFVIILGFFFPPALFRQPRGGRFVPICFRFPPGTSGSASSLLPSRSPSSLPPHPPNPLRPPAIAIFSPALQRQSRCFVAAPGTAASRTSASSYRQRLLCHTYLQICSHRHIIPMVRESLRQIISLLHRVVQARRRFVCGLRADRLSSAMKQINYRSP